MKSLGCPYIEKEIEVECKAVSEDLNDIVSIIILKYVSNIWSCLNSHVI